MEKQSPSLQVICPLCSAVQYNHNKCDKCRTDFRFQPYPSTGKSYYELKDENDNTIKPRA